MSSIENSAQPVHYFVLDTNEMEYRKYRWQGHGKDWQHTDLPVYVSFTNKDDIILYTNIVPENGLKSESERYRITGQTNDADRIQDAKAHWNTKNHRKALTSITPQQYKNAASYQELMQIAQNNVVEYLYRESRLGIENYLGSVADTDIEYAQALDNRFSVQAKSKDKCAFV